MASLFDGIQEAIGFMEDNLTEDIKIRDIAEKAYVSEFYFQRIFMALCGFTVTEYLRNRRMTLAARDLAERHEKVIDVAMKYRYDSPDSFTKAFLKFHGITPSAARQKGAKLKDFAPLHIKLSLEGGTIMDYRVEEKEAFTVMGVKRAFHSETSYQEIPKYWEELMNSADVKVKGAFGICMDENEGNFDYMIADLYCPWQAMPEGYETRCFPAGTWIVFPCTLKTLQDTNTKMWREWLPNCREYELSGNYNFELYAPPTEGSDDLYCELWLPVRRK